MTRLGRTVVGLLLAGALLVAAGPVSATSADRPFKTTFAGQVVMPTPGSATFDGTGRANLMGRVTTAGQAMITGFDESTCPGGLANDHVATLTAANGDTLTITSQDVACPVAPGSPRFIGSGHWTVTGGHRSIRDVHRGGHLRRLAGPRHGHVRHHPDGDRHLRRPVGADGRDAQGQPSPSTAGPTGGRAEP